MRPRPRHRRGTEHQAYRNTAFWPQKTPEEPWFFFTQPPGTPAAPAMNDSAETRPRATSPRSATPIVGWQDEYSVGLPEVDEQHKMLFEIINRLWNATVTKASSDEMMAIVTELDRYTFTHFTAEETFMRVIEYSGFEAHRKAHQGFIERLRAERANVLNGGHLSLDLLRFLREWLVNHILIEDKRYAASHLKDSPGFSLGKFFKRFWS